MKKSFLSLVTILLSALILSACNLGAATPTSQPDLAYTQAAQTVQALLTSPAPTAGPIIESATATTQIPAATPTTANTATETLEPTATVSPTPENCTNLIDFVDDVTVPDDTAFLPGQTFIKTWRLLNVGTCTWTSAYSLVFVDGDSLNANSPVALPTSVQPGEEVDLSVTMTAPGVPGSYTSNWMLRTPSGTNFGTHDDGSGPFWAQIIVQEGSDELNMGSPDWRDPMDSSSNWYLLSTTYTRFTMDEGRMQMTVIQPGSGEEWGLSARPELENFYLQVTFITGEVCGDADRYGVLVRAPDPDQGYVYGFSCNGRYRIYAWADDTYRALQEWRTSSAIRSGAEQTNVLGIWMVDETIRLYANGQLLAEFTDDEFDAGRFGLFIGSPDTDDFTVYVDEVSTWNLDD